MFNNSLKNFKIFKLPPVTAILILESEVHTIIKDMLSID